MTARAESHSDSGSVYATVARYGGSGGDGVAHAGRGADVAITNAAQATTTGQIWLQQFAGGGYGGHGPGSRGGDASSVLSPDSSTGLGLQIDVIAYGGEASSPDGTVAGAARGGNSETRASALDTAGGRIQIDGVSRAGRALGPNSRGGSATLDLEGRSTAGGDVSINGEAEGGNGAVGGSVDLVDAVRGDTTGRLYLTQTAGGGDGTDQAGTGSSRLHASGSYQSLYMEVTGAGGFVGENPPADNNAADHADGFAEADGRNAAGSAEIWSWASGGGTDIPPSGSGGGDAEARAVALTEGDGHGSSAYSVATGGSVRAPGAVHLGAPGNARAAATATATGDSEVSAYANAAAGNGRLTGAGSVTTGSASADATASGRHADVRATAIAKTNGTDFPVDPTQPLDAHATARANGLGYVSALGMAIGRADDSTSRAIAGSSGDVMGSEATLIAHGAQQEVAFDLTTQADFRSVETHSRSIDPLSRLALINAVPDPAEAAAWASDNSAVSAALASASRVLGLGIVSATDGVDASLRLELDGSAFAHERLSVGFVDGIVPLSGFELLQIDISLDGNPVAEFSFSDPLAAAAALQDSLVALDANALGDGVATLVIRYVLDFDASLAGQAFASDVIVFAHGVPEPEPTFLVAALAALVYARSRSSRISVSMSS